MNDVAQLLSSICEFHMQRYSVELFRSHLALILIGY